MIPALMVPMNVNRGGAFGDESFASARSSALRAYREIFGPSSPEFGEFAAHLMFDWGLSGDVSDLHERFLACAAQALRPQDKVRWLMNCCFPFLWSWALMNPNLHPNVI